MLGMSDSHILEHFKEPFPLKIESQLLERHDIDTAIVKEQVFVLVFKTELLQAANPSMLAHMKCTTDSTVHKSDTNKRSKLGTSHEVCDKTVIIHKGYPGWIQNQISQQT